MEYDVIQGDIAAQSADALVNAAGTSLRMGSGVAGALRRGAGDEINEAAMEKGPVDLGAVAVTDAYDLEAEYVIHAAAMPHYGDGEATASSIREATHNALENADKLDCQSLVIPALGAVVSPDSISPTVPRSSARKSPRTSPIRSRDVRFIAYSDEEVETVRKATGETV